MADRACIEARGLTVQRGQHVLLDQVSLCLSGSQVVALLGPNGAGKSTLLKTIGRLVAVFGRAAPRRARGIPA
jgi:ABC-type multidrug transport system ATPase subunit